MTRAYAPGFLLANLFNEHLSLFSSDITEPILFLQTNL